MFRDEYFESTETCRLKLSGGAEGMLGLWMIGTWQNEQDDPRYFKGQVIATAANQICIDGLHIHTSVKKSLIFFQLSRRV